MLDTAQKGPKETRLLPPQVHSQHLRHLKPTIVGPAHNISEHQAAVRDIETVSEKVTRRRLDWLGHLARMPDKRTPKINLFSWLPEPRPQGGPLKRWKDMIRKDLKEMHIPEDTWYAKATTSGAEWRDTYRKARADNTHREQHRKQADNQVQCPECSRTFRRESDKKRHKCLAERQKPVSEQRGALQCPACKKLFRSHGGFTVHTCSQCDH